MISSLSLALCQEVMPFGFFSEFSIDINTVLVDNQYGFFNDRQLTNTPFSHKYVVGPKVLGFCFVQQFFVRSNT